MASIIDDGNGRRSIQFNAADGKRRTIRLGKIAERGAQAVKLRVELLAAAKRTGHAPDDDTLNWVEALEREMYDRLAAVGLVAPRDAMTLGAYLKAYVAGRADVKQSSRIVYGNVTRNLIAHFGENKPLRDITPGDADAFRIRLATTENLGENTVRRRCSFAKQFFAAAVRRKLIRENPFAGVGGMVRGDPTKFFFVTREMAARVLDACPDIEWKLIFALSRFGGLRCPSEHLMMKWADVDWERGRMTVRSPKTEHHPGGASRVVPIFAELHPLLIEAFEKAEPGSEYILTRTRDPGVNWRKGLTTIVERAGFDPWPKLFHNLRATRQTELSASFPSHVVCKWVGNSDKVALEHYLRVTDDDFARAATIGGPADGAGSEREAALQNPVQAAPDGPSIGATPTDANPRSKALQNPVQHMRAEGRNAAHAVRSAIQNHRENKAIREGALRCGGVQNESMDATGLEPVTSSV